MHVGTQGMAAANIDASLMKLHGMQLGILKEILERSSDFILSDGTKCFVSPEKMGEDDAEESDLFGWDELLQKFDQEREWSTAVASLLRDSSVPEDLLDTRLRSKLQSLANKDVSLTKQIEENILNLRDASKLSMVYHAVLKYDSAIASGSLVTGATLLTKLKESSLLLEPGISNDDIKKAVEQRVLQLESYLVDLPRHYIFVDQKTCIPGPISPAGETQAVMNQVFEAASVLGILSDVLEVIASIVVEQSILPICTVQNAAHGVAERAIYKALKAVCDSILCTSSTSCHKTALIRTFGDVLWPMASTQYIDHKLYPMISTIKEESKDFVGDEVDFELRLEGFLRTSNLGVRLEEKAIKLGLIEEKGERPISLFVKRNLKEIFDTHRSKVLLDVREELMDAFDESMSQTHENVFIESFDVYLKDLCFKVENGHQNTNGKLPTAVPQQLDEKSLSDLHKVEVKISRVEIENALRELSDRPALAHLEGRYSIRPGIARVSEILFKMFLRAQNSHNEEIYKGWMNSVSDIVALVLVLGQYDVSSTPNTVGNGQFNDLPHVAALKYNECIHIFSLLCVLPEFIASNHQISRRKVDLTHLELRIRAAGEEALFRIVSGQEEEMLSAAADVTHWPGIDASSGLRARKAVHGLRASFKRIYDILNDILPLRSTLRIFSRLLNTVCGYITDKILNLEDISEEDSKEIPQVLEPLIDCSDADSIASPLMTLMHSSDNETGISRIQKFLDHVLNAEETDLPRAHDEDQEMVSLMIEWIRLREIAELLDIPSREIAERWQTGRLTRAGFTKDQVINLIKALFEDTAHRREVLHSIT